MASPLQGESFGQKRPSLYQMIKNILREYPSGQVFKEVIQNADDAGATEIKFFLDCRQLQTLPPGLVTDTEKHVELSRFYGPALMSFNNAPFKKEDWDSIQSLHQSGKAKNPHKVGKFGIGFNSVYHITDLPVIVSEDYCGFLEPQEDMWKGESGRGYYLNNLLANCPETLAPYKGICGFSKSFYGQTLLRFPLRNKPSKLSKELYTILKLRVLLESLKAEAKYILLFLRSVCSIEVIEISVHNTLKSVFKVSVDIDTYNQHITQHQQLLSDVQSTFIIDSLSSVRNVIKNSDHFNIEVNDDRSHSKHEWIVVNQVGSEDTEVMQLAEKQHVLPWVGTAFEVNSTPCCGGRIFCVLPLPIEDRAPFSVHINGTFAVSSNRRSLKWEAQERKDDEESTWNKLLVKKCLPSCYIELISQLIQLCPSNYTAIYSCWPDIDQVKGTPWDDMLEPFYRQLLYSNKVLYTPVFGGQWISISESIFVDENEVVPQPVKECILRCQVKLVEVDHNQMKALYHYCTYQTNVLNPLMVRTELKGNSNSYDFISNQDKLAVLDYCLSDHKYNDLSGLKLLPLLNGDFVQFTQTSYYSYGTTTLYICSSSTPHTLLPGLEHILVSVYYDNPITHSNLTKVAKSGQTQLKVLGVPEVADLLSQSNPESWSDEELASFWQWLHDKELRLFYQKHIVPIKHLSTIMPLAKQGGVVYVPPYFPVSSTLVVALEKCSIILANTQDFPYLVHNHLTQYLYQFNSDDILDAMQGFSLENVKFSNEEAETLQTFLSSSTLSTVARVNTVCTLPIFSVIQDTTGCYSINSIKTSYCDHKAIAEIESFELQKDLLTVDPLTITSDGNEVNLLRQLSQYKHVTFMNEIEYLVQISFYQIRNRQFNISNVVPFMTSILDSFDSMRRKYPSLFEQFKNAISTLPFIPVSSSTVLQAPCNLFDPQDAMLKELFREQSVFPGPEFSSYLYVLRQCGLKSITSITATDIVKIITSDQVYLGTGLATSNDVNISRIVAVFHYLSQYPQTLDQRLPKTNDNLQNALVFQAQSSCWLPVVSNSPVDYPTCLNWKGSLCHQSLASGTYSPLVVLSQNISSSQLPMIAGSQALFVESVPSQIAQTLCSSPQIMVAAVVAHFKEIIQNKDKIEPDVLDQLSYQTYSYLQNNIAYCDEETFDDIENWVWMESESTFIGSSMVAIRSNPTFRQSLEPFVFTLSNRLQKFNKLFSKCGIHPQITTNHILSVLQSIKDRPDQISTEEAWSLVKAILDWVVDDLSKRMNDGDVLVPVQSDSSYPQLQLVKDVVYTDNEMLLNIAMTSDEDYMLVHDRVAHLAPQLGLSPLSDHLDITEDVFEDAGQHEPLVTRLSNILKEYKDGLTIIKEMIQNADDAEATEVNILYDARHHTTEKLLLKGMADSHGPALVVHNNSTFTNEDFENITKLAGATKANKPLKIGKFGVGFCSVYHITDVPSFVSGEWVYIFDPTLQYLKGIVRNENRPGKKVKYLSKFVSQSEQLVPYEGLFGFKGSTVYNGTMFRFPFRRCPSQISSTVYNEHMISQLRKDLTDNGSKLLLFLQHVKRITFSSIDSYSSEPKLQVSIEMSSLSSQREIKFVTNNKKDLVEYWLVSNHNEELQTQDYQMHSSTASVACQLIKADEHDIFSCKQIKGSVFCFLPLVVPSTGLPVHVSANFAVMSNRHGIWTGSSRIATDSREWWNQKLMETTIPKAYCSLLNTLQVMCISGQLLNYKFYSLWPLNTRLQSKHPWDILSSTLYKMISENSLFHSASINKWLTLTESKFISSGIFNKLGLANDEMLSCIQKAVYLLQISVVFLPHVYMQQISQYDIAMIDENDFASIFFPNIDFFNSEVDVRNDILSHMLSTIAVEQTQTSLLKSHLQDNPCIPVSPHGKKLKLASELVDPLALQNLFDPEDEMFPLPDFYSNSLIRQAMWDLGLISSNLPYCIINESAKTIASLFFKDKSIALVRVKLIIKTIEEKSYSALLSQQSTNTEIELLQNIPFLPVVSQPEHYILFWKGAGRILRSPSQVISMDISKAAVLVGSQKAIVNTSDDGGCGYIPDSVLTVLGIPTRPSLDDVLLHFQCLLDTFKPMMCQNSKVVDEISQLCSNIYEFIDDEIRKRMEPGADGSHSSVMRKAPSSSIKIEEKLMEFQTKPFIWTETCFAIPDNVAKHWKKNGPYLFKLPDILSERKNLLNALQVQDNFNAEKLLNTFRCILDDHRAELPSEYYELVDFIILELNSAPGEVTELDEVILVDEHYILRPVKELSFNDAPWLPPPKNCKYVHSKLIREKALSFGVKPIRNKFLEKFVSPLSQQFGGSEFGQKEELTQRIKNILHDYPLDVTFLKELLQNADDAKATKMCVILDKRTHGKDQILSERWAELQGPALLVWNDSDFLDKDLEGIQQLGLGSKQDDTESIGQFGIGFNVVYHVTDCPSFITRGNILCVFDPHCCYVPGADRACPGRRYDVDDNFWKNMSDLQSAYLQDSLPEQLSYLKKGSLFRFPLRSTASKIVEEEILAEPLTAKIMEKKLVNWVHQIKDALLFLNHITQLEFYVIDADTNEFHCKDRYKVHLDDSSHEARSSFYQIISNFKDFMQPQVVTYPLTMITSTDEEKWLIQQGVGDLQNSSQNWTYINQTLPTHCIAAPMQYNEYFSGKVFCFLPLPVQIGLPVHINGQFVLSSHRSLWNSDSGDDDQTKWNLSLFQAIVSSYVHFLSQARDYYVHPEGYQSLDDLYSAVNCYYNLLPFYLGKPAEKTKLAASNRSQGTISDQRVFSQNLIASNTAQTNLDKSNEFHWLFFQSLWFANVPVLASEVFPSSQEALYFVKWHLLHNDDNPINQAFFKTKMDKKLEQILRNIGMILTYVPHELYNHLEEFNPAIADNESVYNYYTTFYSHIISSYPISIEETPFNSIENFCIFLKHLLKVSVKDSEAQCLFPCCPFGYPLLLTADGKLRLFNEHNKVLCSKFSHLFTKSASLFLHPKILDKFPSLCINYFLSAQDVSFSIIVKIMRENYSPLLQNSELVNYKCVLDNDALKELWLCMTKDQIFEHHQDELLKSWALIPSTSQTLYSTCSPILPLVTPSDVTELQFTETFQMLAYLGIPILNSKISKATKIYCPQMTNYNRVLAVLFHMHVRKDILNNLKDPKETVCILFKYFSRINFRHDYDSVIHITSLPLFETICGHLTSICGKKVCLWPADGFCKAGYEKWAPIDGTVFLDPRGTWRSLCNDISNLGGEELDRKNIYADIIFPIFHQLLSKEREEHLRYIKDEMYQDIVYESEKGENAASIFLNKLKALKCLESKNETLYSITKFSDHTASIFTLFPSHFDFVPEEYKKDEWLEFLRGLGLRVTTTCEEFKTFCELVSQGQHSDLVKVSEVLVNYLFSKSTQEWHDNDSYLAEIGNISFVQVDLLNSLRWIKAPCQPSCYFSQQNVGLTKLNEAVIYDSAPLVWTVKPVVSLPNMDYLKQQEYDNFLNKLGITTNPEVNDVYTNILNVSKTGLANFKLFNKYDPKYICDIKDQDKLTITDVIVKSLQYLFERKTNDLLQNLHMIPCIPVQANISTTEYYITQPVLVTPIQVVRYLSPDDKDLFPYLHSLPTYLNIINEELDIMGVCQNISIANIQHLLETMYSQFNDSELDPNSEACVQKAITKLYILLKEISKPQVIKPLYLPALLASRNNRYSLKDSTSLVFIDSNRYQDQDLTFINTPYSLFQLPSDTKMSVASKQSMAILPTIANNKNICLLLPNEVRPKGLSLCCTEKILIRCECQDNSPLKFHLQKLKNLVPSLNEVLPKILSAHYESAMMTVDDTIIKFTFTLTELIKSVPVVVIQDLRSKILLMSEYHIGSMKVQFLLQKDDDNYTLFVDVESSSGYSLQRELARTLCIEVARIHNVDLTTYLKFVTPVCECLQTQCLNDLNPILEKYIIKDQGLHDLQDKVKVSTKFIDKCIQCDYWNYTNISDSFEGMVTIGKKLCLYNAHTEHELILEQCGLRLVIPGEVIIPVESIYEVAAQGLWGAGKFVFPEGTTLISGVCYISVSSSSELNKPVTIELMHCAHITDERQTQYLSFVAAKSGPPFKFDYLPGGSFSSESQCGTISLKQFSLLAIVLVVSGAALLALGHHLIRGHGDNVKLPNCYYQAYVFYKSINTKTWNMNFAITQDSKYSKHIHEVTSFKKFGIEDCNFRFRFSAKTYPPGESEVLDDREEKIIKLTGFPADEVLIKGWRVEPQRIPPLINKNDVDDFHASKSANSPYIPVLIVADPDCSNFKEQLQYPLSIEGIEVTTADSSQPKIVLYRTYTHCPSIAYKEQSDSISQSTSALDKELNSSEIFQSYSADLITSIASDLERITDRLFADNIIGQSIVQLTTVGSESNYSKARKVVHELYSQLQAHSEPKQYLGKICHVLLKQDDQRLKEIAKNIKEKL